MFTMVFANLDNLTIQFDCELIKTHEEESGMFKDHPKFNVTMTSCGGLISETFDYWEAVGNFDMGATEYANFLMCTMDDVLSSQMSFEDFCIEFGCKIYEEENEERVRAIWQACKEVADKCINLGLYPIASDIFNAINDEEFTITED